MNKTEVLALLKANQNDRGTQHWKGLGAAGGGLKSFGIGLTQLRKLAKQIGRNHDLALKLWGSKVYDAKIIALLIDDPKAITRDQAEMQVEGLGPGGLAHVFSSCGAPLAKAPIALELANDWMDSKDAMRRGCGYGLLYEVSKSKKKSTPDNAYFLERIKHIGSSFEDEERPVQGAMGCALMGIGKRNKKLNAAALKVARAIGPIQFGDDDDNCEPFDVVKHLTSDYLRDKLGV